MAVVTVCPEVSALQRFLLGQSSADEAELLELHLEHCERCIATLHTLHGRDSLVDALQAPSAVADGPSEAAQGLAERLKQLRPGEEDGAPTLAYPAGRETWPPPAATDGGPEPRDSGRPTDVLCDFLAPAQAADELGRLGHYRVLKVLGHGGMGVVFQARDPHLERLVALKAMLPGVAASPSCRQRFLREARLAAALKHDHIVTVYQVGEDRGAPYLAMEFLEGESLHERLKREGRLPVAEVLRIGREMAEGLAAAHQRGLIHRDIKPGNIWLETRQDERTKNGEAQAPRPLAPRVKILDFGLARATAEPAQLTQSGFIIGTPSFMAPEQVAGQPVDARADLFSLGCVLYRMATGQPPFKGPDIISTLVAVASDDPRRPKRLNPDLPPALCTLIERLLAKKPEDRPASARAVIEAIGAIEQGDALTCRRRRTAARRLLAVAALLLGFAVLAGGVAVYRIQTDNGELVISTDNPDVEVIVKQNGKLVRILDTKTGKEVRLHSGFYELELGRPADGLKLSPEKITIRRGDMVVATVQRVPATPELLHAIPWQDEEQGFPANIGQTGISADGRLFFGAGDAGPSGRIRLFDVTTGKLVKELVPEGEVWYSFAQFVPGGKYLVASYSKDNDIYLWDIAAGKVVRKFVGHSEPGAQFTAPDGKRFLSWADDRTVRLWDVATGKELRQLVGHTDKAAGVFSPDGKQVLTFSPDRTLRLWDVEKGTEVKRLEGHTDACTGCFSPDGKQALSYGPDGTIRLWDLGTGKEVRRFDGPTDKVAFAGFLAGGRLVVGRTDDQQFRLWQTASGRLVGTIDGNKYGRDGWSLTATPDGRQALVSVEGDGSVRVLALPGGQETHRYDGCPKARAWSFARDGRVVVAGSFRAGTYVFRLPAPPQEPGAAEGRLPKR